MGAQNTEALGAKAHEEMLKKERRANNVWNKLKRNKTAMIGLVIVLFMVGHCHFRSRHHKCGPG